MLKPTQHHSSNSGDIMKYLLFTLVAAALICAPLWAAESPVAKGASILTGGISFSAQKMKYEDEDNHETISMSTFSFDPALDYFVANHIFLGVGTAVSDIVMSGSSFMTFGAGPEVGYAFGNPAATAFPYIKGMALFTHGSAEHYKVNDRDLGLAVGVMIPVHKHIGITTEMSIHNVNENETTDYGDYWGELKQSSSGTLFKMGIGINGLFF
jgi:hypothetical protein